MTEESTWSMAPYQIVPLQIPVWQIAHAVNYIYNLDIQLSIDLLLFTVVNKNKSNI